MLPALLELAAEHAPLSYFIFSQSQLGISSVTYCSTPSQRSRVWHLGLFINDKDISKGKGMVALQPQWTTSMSFP